MSVNKIKLFVKYFLIYVLWCNNSYARSSSFLYQQEYVDITTDATTNNTVGFDIAISGIGLGIFVSVGMAGFSIYNYYNSKVPMSPKTREEFINGSDIPPKMDIINAARRAAELATRPQNTVNVVEEVKQNLSNVAKQAPQKLRKVAALAEQTINLVEETLDETTNTISPINEMHSSITVEDSLSPPLIPLPPPNYGPPWKITIRYEDNKTIFYKVPSAQNIEFKYNPEDKNYYHCKYEIEGYDKKDHRVFVSIPFNNQQDSIRIKGGAPGIDRYTNHFWAADGQYVYFRSKRNLEYKSQAL